MFDDRPTHSDNLGYTPLTRIYGLKTSDFDTIPTIRVLGFRDSSTFTKALFFLLSMCDDLLDHVIGACIFSSLDLASGIPASHGLGARVPEMVQVPGVYGRRAHFLLIF